MIVEKTLRQVCSELKISRRTIQGYEKLGLVKPCGKNKYGHLLYGKAEKDRIKAIRFYQQIGFSLREIKELLDAPNEIKKVAVQSKIVELEERCMLLERLVQEAKQYIAVL